MFDRVGGAVTIDRLVEAFYSRMDTLPEAGVIRAMHAPELGPVKNVLKRYLSEWTGGPKLYSPEKGHPRLRAAHGICDRQCRARCVAALHARRARGDGG
jgi:hemoglobin